MPTINVLYLYGANNINVHCLGLHTAPNASGVVLTLPFGLFSEVFEVCGYNILVYNEFDIILVYNEFDIILIIKPVAQLCKGVDI